MASFEKSSYADYEKYKLAKQAERKRRRKRANALIQSHRNPCLFCGSEKNIEFHHFNPTEKEYGVTDIITLSPKKIVEEINKCWCLCKSCHNKLHRRLCDPLPSCYDS